MVIYNEIAAQDLEDILYNLATWKKHPLGFEHATKYVDDITNLTDTICTRSFHKNVVYSTHKKFGSKVFQYHRNSKTQWNVIYNWDKKNRIAYVNKIISNYKTIGKI